MYDYMLYVVLSLPCDVICVRASASDSLRGAGGTKRAAVMVVLLLLALATASAKSTEERLGALRGDRFLTLDRSSVVLPHLSALRLRLHAAARRLSGSEQVLGTAGANLVADPAGSDFAAPPTADVPDELFRDLASPEKSLAQVL